MNATVEATGMHVTAQADSSLLIGTDLQPNKSEIDFQDDDDYSEIFKLVPCTYMASGKLIQKTEDDKSWYQPIGDGETANGAAGYYAAYDPKSWVDTATGEVIKNEEGTAAATEKYTNVSSEEGYYIDYVAYIATAGQELVDNYLKAKVTFATVNDTDTFGNYTHKALTVDFKVGYTYQENSASWATLADDSTIVRFAAATDDAATKDITKQTDINPVGNLTAATEEGGTLTVIMRVYFDGALKGAGSQYAYVNSTNVNLENVGIAVSFSASTTAQGA